MTWLLTVAEVVETKPDQIQRFKVLMMWLLPVAEMEKNLN